MRSSRRPAGRRRRASQGRALRRRQASGSWQALRKRPNRPSRRCRRDRGGPSSPSFARASEPDRAGSRRSPFRRDRSWATEASRSPQREEKTQASSSVWAFVSFRKASSEKSASAAAFPRGERRRRSPAGTAFAPGTASACGSQEKSAVTGAETPGRKRAASRIWAQKGMSRHLGMKTGPRGRIELESIAAKRFA